MNKIDFEQRCKVYTNALIAFGAGAQMIVAIEELSECQKEICKIMRGGENFPHLAEEIADATIMLEQLRLMFNLNEAVCEQMDRKVLRLDERLQKGAQTDASVAKHEDAVPVRCEKCQFSHENPCNGTLKCTAPRGLHRVVESDEFCSWGERENP